jgi:general secretion pathway protein D
VNAVSQQVQYVNVGVNLQIEPRISSDGFVTSHVFSEVSSVTGYQQGYPTLSQREATTTATVKDGESFVIGGLLETDELRSLAKVPGIGDLPLIGWLFRVRHDQMKSTNLYIIVTPHILTNGNPVPPGVPR